MFTGDRIMGQATKRLLEVAAEAAAIARGEKTLARVHVAADIDVRAIRQKLRLSQDDFASQFGFSANQIKDWKQRRSRPIGGVGAYLMIIDQNSESARKILSGIKKAA